VTLALKAVEPVIRYYPAPRGDFLMTLGGRMEMVPTPKTARHARIGEGAVSSRFQQRPQCPRRESLDSFLTSIRPCEYNLFVQGAFASNLARAPRIARFSRFG
jgi:hypothetical protein